MYDIENLFDYWNDCFNYYSRYIAYTQRQALRIVEKAIFGSPKRIGTCPENSSGNQSSRREGQQ